MRTPRRRSSALARVVLEGDGCVLVVADERDDIWVFHPVGSAAQAEEVARSWGVPSRRLRWTRAALARLGVTRRA